LSHSAGAAATALSAAWRAASCPDAEAEIFLPVVDHQWNDLLLSEINLLFNGSAD
jgi:hypothetical protein